MKQALCILVAFALFSCNTSVLFDSNKTPLAQVGDKVLYLEDVEKLIDVNVAEVDKDTIVKSYVEKWATDQLIYNLALYHLNNKEDIDALVEDYKKMLYIFNYQKQFVEAHTAYPAAAEVFFYYKSNQELFLQEEKLLRGVFVAQPNNMKNGEKVKRLLKKFKVENLEQIEKFTLNDAMSYDYFIDQWVEMSKICEMLPLSVSQGDFSDTKKYYEFSDSTTTYVLYVDSMVNIGSVAPFDYAKPFAKEMLYDKTKMDNIKNFAPRVYDEAIQEKKIILF